MVTKKKVELTGQELDDLLSALGYFIRTWPSKKENPITMRAMDRLSKKLWKVVKSDENS